MSQKKKKITVHSVQVPVSDEYYDMVDSGTNAVIVPLRPDMCGEIAECKVPSATIERPIVQVLKHGSDKRLVVVLPQSAILISQEWATCCRLDIHSSTQGRRE